ncbi:DUF3168 domain-containing protein [Leisingera daeponensis]|uniref:DUF3168 domain-containing protein n=1 Tax=Leisingera daeponensis TaxID=405746 RepID=A0ABS7NBE6_9RHOB|nr:DUF3168 domain-containing protein [Leisingera daeponensis]MBY6138528.1 DUF3168 domain-containing protein [Leisingera daeponensis]
MADGYLTAAQVGLRAALVADPGVATLVGDRVVDEPGEGIHLPYVRFGRSEVSEDDAGATRGAIVQFGLEVHSRAGSAGKVEASHICEAVSSALHKRPEVVAAEGFTVTEVEIQTWYVERARNGKDHLGRLALQVHLDA